MVAGNWRLSRAFLIQTTVRFYQNRRGKSPSHVPSAWPSAAGPGAALLSAQGCVSPRSPPSSSHLALLCTANEASSVGSSTLETQTPPTARSRCTWPHAPPLSPHSLHFSTLTLRGLFQNSPSSSSSSSALLLRQSPAGLHRGSPCPGCSDHCHCPLFLFMTCV